MKSSHYVLTWLDLILPPFYFLLLFAIVWLIKKYRVKDPIMSKYFLPGFFSKIFGAIMVVIIYQFYYRGGDTSDFFFDSYTATDIFFDSPYKYFLFLFAKPGEFIPEIAGYTYRIYFYADPNSLLIIKIASLLNFLTFSSFVGTSMLFGVIGFTGAWYFFRTLCLIDKTLHRQFAFATMFFPSMIIWGSGLIKDTISLSALGFIFYTTYKLFILKEFKTKYLIALFAGLYLIIAVKVYILICLLPATCIWLFVEYTNRIKSRATRGFLKPLMLAFSILVGLIGASFVVENDVKYNFSNITETARITADYIGSVSKMENGSFYNIGQLDVSPTGILRIFPSAVVVSLFRPFLWEIRNILMALSSLEAFFLLLLTTSTFYRIGFFRTLAYINTNAYVVSALIFAITFAFAVGVSTSNFGTLARYKTPLIPFFISAIYIIRNNAGSKVRTRVRITKESTSS